MRITVWKTKNRYFEKGVIELNNLLCKDSVLVSENIVFIDFSMWNIRGVLSGCFSCLLSEGAKLVFICDDNTLPIGMYYSYIINSSVVVTKKSKPIDILNKLMSKKEGFDNNFEWCSSRVITSNELSIIKSIIMKNMSIGEIASKNNINVKTVYSRYYSILKKMRINKSRFIAF